MTTSPEFGGITYPQVFYRFKRLWKLFMCHRGIHLFDEVCGTGVKEGQDYERRGWSHYLYCDACGLTVHIAEIEHD